MRQLTYLVPNRLEKRALENRVGNLLPLNTSLGPRIYSKRFAGVERNLSLVDYTCSDWARRISGG